VVLVVLKREKLDTNLKNNRFKFNYPVSGILLAFGGSVGQAVGLVLSKYGMGDYNAFAASQIRVLAGLFGFTLIFIFMKRWGRLKKSLSDKKGMGFTVLGSVFGPFLGVSFSLLAIQYTNTGVASTIMSIVPVLIIPPAVLFFKEKINLKEVIGSVMAVCGVAILFLS
jgi:drug/metabolite transporter (DMT)-like permease